MKTKKITVRFPDGKKIERAYRISNGHPIVKYDGFNWFLTENGLGQIIGVRYSHNI